ncbi:hypothetical protein [Thiobacillus sedimenti]|uniref:Glycine zipper domain-containing protein n=1 Tax=Thiobacillus sedimenti TaxID=3110231 RepID=A0ABZ1CM65_9PROT|nr:hypothetical protein [Thiobacillus sp. SCUT-2]WRS39971.1 hypothetical protein VA613_03625 [Thiobacillus sp. SCUT-2]
MVRKHTLVILALATCATPAFAGGIDGGAVLGGAIGGGAGAAVGSAIGGRDGAIIGGAIGGATGAAVGSKDSKRSVVEREVVYEEGRGHHDNGLHRGHHKGRHGRDDD